MEIKIDEKQIADAIINELKRHNLLSDKPQNVTVVYNAESQDVLHTVSEVAELIKCNTNFVYQLIRAGLPWKYENKKNCIAGIFRTI